MGVSHQDFAEEVAAGAADNLIKYLIFLLD